MLIQKLKTEPLASIEVDDYTISTTALGDILIDQDIPGHGHATAGHGNGHGHGEGNAGGGVVVDLINRTF